MPMPYVDPVKTGLDHEEGDDAWKAAYSPALRKLCHVGC